MLKKKGLTIPETLSDCICLYEKGYTIEVNDGQIITVKKGKKYCYKKYVRNS